MISLILCWLSFGWLLNTICMILLNIDCSYKAIIFTLLTCWIGPIGLLNIIGLLLLKLSDNIIFSKTFIKIQDNLLKYIYL